MQRQGGICQSLCTNTAAPLPAVPFCSLAGDRAASRVPQERGTASVPCELPGEWGHDPLLGPWWDPAEPVTVENALTCSGILLGVVTRGCPLLSGSAWRLDAPGRWIWQLWGSGWRHCEPRSSWQGVGVSPLGRVGEGGTLPAPLPGSSRARLVSVCQPSPAQTLTPTPVTPRPPHPNGDRSPLEAGKPGRPHCSGLCDAGRGAGARGGGCTSLPNPAVLPRAPPAPAGPTGLGRASGGGRAGVTEPTTAPPLQWRCPTGTAPTAHGAPNALARAGTHDTPPPWGWGIGTWIFPLPDGGSEHGEGEMEATSPLPPLGSSGT